MSSAKSELIQATALDIVRRLRGAGFRALWAGGCVRDRLLGRESKDIDIVTDARPDQVQTIFPHGKGVGRAFGVVLVHEEGHDFEVATFRQDADYEDGRRPTAVTFTDERTDALRRDFTINAMFYDPVTDEVHDYVGGRADLAARMLRAVGDPEARFREDHLRMLRGVRFASVLDFTLDPATADAIRRNADKIAGVSAERVRVELTRLLRESARAGRGLALLRETGLLKIVLPEVDAMAGVEQPKQFHPEGDVFEHTCRMLDLLKHPSIELAWAVLLHDVGKPPTARFAGARAGDEPRWRFDEHDRVGAELARAIVTRLRFSNRQIEDIVQCVGNHMRYMEVPRMRAATLRRLVAAPTFPVELELHRLDCLSSHGDISNCDLLQAKIKEWADTPALPRALVRGRDVMARFELPEGPEVGRLTKLAYEKQLEHPGWTKTALIEWLAKQPAADGAG